MQIVNTKYQIIRKYSEPHWQPRDYSYESLVGRLWNGFADLENDAEAAKSDRENRAPPIERRSQNCRSGAHPLQEVSEFFNNFQEEIKQVEKLLHNNYVVVCQI